MEAKRENMRVVREGHVASDKVGAKSVLTANRVLVVVERYIVIRG